MTALLTSGSLATRLGLVLVTIGALVSAPGTAHAQVSVTPDGGNTVANPSSSNVASFQIINDLGFEESFSFACFVSGVVTSCTQPGSVSIPAGSSAWVDVTYATGASGSGTLSLLAAGSISGAFDDGSYNVTLVSYGVAVTPDGGTAAARTANTGGYSETFTVRNTGTTWNTFSFSCSGAGGVTCGSVPGSVPLGPGAQTDVSMPYSVGAAGTGTLTLTASGTNASDQGSYSVPIVSYAVSVTPDGGTAPTRTANTGGHSEPFTVTNNGSAQNTFSFSCSGAGGVTCGTAPASVPINPGQSANVSMPYSVGAPGSGTLTLTAAGTNTGDAGSFSVPIVSYGVSVTPDGGTRTANTGGHSEQFTVTNTGSAPNTFSFVCSGVGGVTCGTVPAPVPIQPGLNANVSMPYSVGAPGTGTLTLTANGTNASNPGSYSVPIVSYGVSVTPDGATTPARTPNSTGHSETFTVTNTGSAANTFSINCSGTGGVVCGTLPSPVNVPGNNGQVPVAMPYSVGNAGTGTLTLTANGTNASNQGSYTVPVSLSGISASGVFTKDNRYLLQETAVTYEATGRITELKDARDNVTRFEYDGNQCQALVTKVTRVKDGIGDLITDLACNTEGYVAWIEDEANTRRYFTYDTFGRLTEVRNHGNTLVTQYGYTYSRTGPNWTFDANNPNAVTTTAYRSATQTIPTSAYVDGLGRPIQTIVENGTADVVTATQYDNMGRPWRTWAPYTAATSSYVPTFSAGAEGFYNTYHGTSNAKPYVETAYRPDVLERVSKVNPEYLGTSPDSVVHRYGIVGAPTNYRVTEVADEMGRKTRQFTDAFGNVMKIVLGAGAPESTVTTFAYNVLGQRTQVTDPRNLVTTYTFDTRGLLTSKLSPDAGTIAHKYDQAANLRYTQDANQALAGQVYFTTYDFANRPLVSGQGAATFSSLNPFTSAAFEGTNANWLVVRAYDAKPTNVFPWSQFWTQISPITLNNVPGRLAAVASKSNGAWQVTLFSHDADGQVVKRYTYTQANGGGSVLTALNTTSTYVRDLRGALTSRADTVGSSTFHHWYEYDTRGLLWKVFAATSSIQPGTPDVTYTYRPSGQLQSRLFAGGTTITLRYTIREQLEKIGDPALMTFPFAARYDYHPNGTVLEADFYSAGSPATAKRYKYWFGGTNYDALNRLKGADFTPWIGGTWSPSSTHDLGPITYDAAGNILTLQRRQDAGTILDNLTYTIAATSNRLTVVADAVDGSPEAWDAEDGSFGYDANGNITTLPPPYAITTPITYDHQNLALSITRGGTTTTYRYNEAGRRITKQVGSGNTEAYLLDAATSLGVFTVNGSGGVVASYFNILAGEKVVGRRPSTGGRRYYHTDLLGSTRSVVDSITGAVLESYDFEPWGLLMPGRTLGSGTKEGFTGKEQDAETGLDYFGARYYMPALGRWTSVDPVADSFPQWSPYNYALDNSVANTDPDGRCVIVLDCPITIPILAAATVAAVAKVAVVVSTAVAATYVAITTDTDVAGPASGTDVKQAADGSAVVTPVTLSKGREGVALPFAQSESSSAGEAEEKPAERGGHRKKARESTRKKHEEGEARKKKDKGGEKGDERRPYRRSGKRAGEE